MEAQHIFCDLPEKRHITDYYNSCPAIDNELTELEINSIV
jgi:hypothetical protein